MFEKLKEIREYEGLTQQEVADKLHVTRATYAGWECGKDIIPLRKLNEFANLFHTSLDYLIGLETNMKTINKALNIDEKKVSETLYQFRKDLNLTQEEFAHSIKTSQSNIHKYETGKTLITTTYALEFIKQYDYSLDRLVGRK